MAKTKKIDVVSLAAQVRELRQQIAAKTEAYKNDIAPIEKEEETLTEVLVQAMRDQGLRAIDLPDGSVAARQVRTSFKIVDDEKAMRWAEETDCFTIDKKKMNVLLTRTIVLPEGFEQTDTHYIKY